MFNLQKIIFVITRTIPLHRTFSHLHSEIFCVNFLTLFYYIIPEGVHLTFIVLQFEIYFLTQLHPEEIGFGWNFRLTMMMHVSSKVTVLHITG